jgi:tetratricopeptide (TPR) repeat protein
MLGLVDTTVARHPERFEGLSSTWKERNYNAGYVLAQKPDIIYFSTGRKPSGFAERALFLYPDFRQNYRLEFLCSEGVFEMFYRRFQNRPVSPKPDQSAHFVNLFNQSINFFLQKNYEKCVALLREAFASGPKDCSVLYTTLGAHYLSAGYFDSSEVYLKKGIELDQGGPASRYYYSVLLYNQKRFSEMAVQDSFLLQTVPNAGEFLRVTRGFGQ